MPFEDALRRVAEESGRLFDPEIVDAFQECIARYTGIVLAPSARSASAFEATLMASGGPTPPARRAIERADDERATYRARAEDADDPEHERPRSERPRAAPAQRVDQSRKPAVAPARNVAARPTVARSVTPAPSQPAANVNRTTASAPAQSLRQPGRRRRSLFSARFYVDAAVRGAWTEH